MIHIDRKVRQIKEHIRGMGVQPAVIDSVDMLCAIIKELSDYVSIPVPKVRDEVSASVETSQVRETELPIPESTGSVKAGKITVTKPKRKPKK